MADFHAPAAFLFYPTDFVADTTDFSAEEVGIYLRLLCRQWTAGSLPSDMVSLAKIGGVSKARMISAWKMLGRCFIPHAQNGQIMQGRLERVRAEALEYHRKKVESGKAGAQRRHSSAKDSLEQKDSTAMVLLEQNGSESTEKKLGVLEQTGSFPYPVPVPENLATLDPPFVSPQDSRRMVRPEMPDVPEGAFGVLESDVARFVAGVAAENATGKISLGRIQSLRRALLAAREEFPVAFAEALRESNARGKPSVNYLRAVAKHHEPPVRPVSPAPDEPEPDYIRAAIALHDRDFGGAA